MHLRVWQASGFTRWERLSYSSLPVQTVPGRLASLDYNLLKLSISSRALGKGLRNIPGQSLTKHITPANVPAEPPAREANVKYDHLGSCAGIPALPPILYAHQPPTVANHHLAQ